MFYTLVMAVGGVFLVLCGWVAVEELVRRKSPRLPDECDETERAHGCHHCLLGDTCEAKPDNEEP